MRLALLIVVLLAAAAPDVRAQRYCYQIEPGETVARLAARLTGDARNRHAAWFQIVDGEWRSLPKHHYDLVQPGWLACLDQGLNAASRASAAAPVHRAPLVRPQVAAFMLPLDFTFLLVGALLVVALSTWRWVATTRRVRKERARVMRRFAADFVREFGRPLTQFRGADPPPKARLRMSPRRSQFEILLAPTNGRRYPNLSDHRVNLEYDVARVVSTLACNTFARGRPYAEGEWVVLPFQYNGSVKQEGVR